MAAPTLLSKGPGNVDELLTTTLVNIRPQIRDNIFKSNPVFNWLHNKKKIRIRGGAAYSHGIMYEKNSTAQSYQRYETLNTDPQDGLTQDQWDWAQYAVSVSIDGFTERVANRGESEIIDLLETKRQQAEMSLAEKLEQHLFAATPGSKDIRSLPVIVLNSGTEGDINGSTNTWWQAQTVASGSFAAQGRKDLTNLYNTVTIQNPVGPPEMLISSQTEFESYESSLVPQERFMDNKMVDIGIMNLKFKNTPWTWSPQASTGTIFMLHSSGLEWVVNADTDFETTAFVKPSNQDARTAQILLACILSSGNRRKLGYLSGVTA